MPFTFQNTKIPGVVIIQPQVFGDSRGYFCETFKAPDFKEAGLPTDFVQDNESSSTKGVLRGLHFQKEHTQGKLVRVTHGGVLITKRVWHKYSHTFDDSYSTTFAQVLPPIEDY